MTQKAISAKREKEIVKEISDFIGWLTTKMEVKKQFHYNQVEFQNSTKDWFMKLHKTNKQIVLFNTSVFNLCSYQYYLTIVIHECFHLFVQDMPHKEDAQRLKDDFGDVIMKLLDIEADYYTALYFKEVKKFSYTDYLKLHYEGSTVFGDPKIRVGKLERFIGSMLSIAKIFIDYPKSNNFKKASLYLPTINNISTEETMNILVKKNEHFYIDQISANSGDFIELKMCYTNLGKLTLEGYIEKITKFITKAYNIRVLPSHILKDLKKQNIKL